jgi:hypothetical protein
MAWLAPPTPLRLGMALSLFVVFSVALEGAASGKHRRPLLRASLAALVTTQPDGFKCRLEREPAYR